MEFITTPDLGQAVRWSTTPGTAARPGATPRAVPGSAGPGAPGSLPHSAVVPTAATPNVPTSASSTPHISSAMYAPVDRAGIKNSFQSLFSPAVAGTPALFARAPSSAPGLTPFINGMATPSLVPPSTNLMANYANISTPHLDPSTSPNPAAVLSSPYLQAAAKEAVRREFMNMPSYVTTNGAPVSGERVVPNKDFAHTPNHHHHPHMTVSSPATVPTNSDSGTRQVSPNSGDAKVPSTSSPTTPIHSAHPHAVHVETTQGSAPLPVEDKHRPLQGQPSVAPQMQPYFMQPHPHPHGMVMIGQHGQMMMAAPPGPMYAPPGMVMFAGGQPGPFQQGMMMHPQHAGQMQRPQGQPVKPETQAERKERIEHEKQELVREFKKKTREAALVRFRQKRRERRFGKLIRYDCRKKLADARPRVKGRFVRIKEDDESESAQVVPGFER